MTNVIKLNTHYTLTVERSPLPDCGDTIEGILPGFVSPQIPNVITMPKRHTKPKMLADIFNASTAWLTCFPVRVKKSYQ